MYIILHLWSTHVAKPHKFVRNHNALIHKYTNNVSKIGMRSHKPED